MALNFKAGQKVLRHPQGDKVKLLAQYNDWVMVSLPNAMPFVVHEKEILRWIENRKNTVDRKQQQ